MFATDLSGCRRSRSSPNRDYARRHDSSRRRVAGSDSGAMGRPAGRQVGPCFVGFSERSRGATDKLCLSVPDREMDVAARSLARPISPRPSIASVPHAFKRGGLNRILRRHRIPVRPQPRRFSCRPYAYLVSRHSPAYNHPHSPTILHVSRPSPFSSPAHHLTCCPRTPRIPGSPAWPVAGEQRRRRRKGPMTKALK
jgi:hypothetical protein